jgi:hypothetical protein
MGATSRWSSGLRRRAGAYYGICQAAEAGNHRPIALSIGENMLRRFRFRKGTEDYGAPSSQRVF